MNPKRTLLALTAALIFQAVFLSRLLFAVELIVDNNNPSCVQPACFTRITDAITYAVQSTTTPTTTTYSITVEPGIYDEAITLSTGIPIQGRETARTILNGTGSGAVVTANGVTSTSISHFTFTNAGVGVLVTANSNISITNNVFFCGLSGIGVQVQTAPSVRIINNTFYQNQLAILRDADITITNNIFSQNSANISQIATGLAQANISYNAFNPAPLASEPTGSHFIPNVILQNQNPDPLFVNPGVRPPDLDLHLKEGSPCINQGTNVSGPGNKVDGFTSDIGAYGGPGDDAIPFPVTNVNASKPDESTIAISWSPNSSYQVSGYRVWYGKSPGVYDGSGALEGNSPIDTTEIGITLHDLSSSVVTTLATASLEPLKIQNGSLGLSWSAVPGATGYRIYYSTSLFGPGTDIPLPFDFSPVDVENSTSYTLTGLTNGQKYYAAVSAVSKTTYYIAVTALDTAQTTSFIPGKADESAYFKEVPVGLGAASEGAISNLQNEYPDVVLAQPALPNSRSGCFIATAAYGHYSSPQVQALRDFRDAYLLRSGPGRAFVEWYYTHSPAAAAWLTAHPGYKPLVRTALAPAVGMSLVMTRTPFLFKAAAFVLLVLFTGFMVHRRRRPSRS